MVWVHISSWVYCKRIGVIGAGAGFVTRNDIGVLDCKRAASWLIVREWVLESEIRGLWVALECTIDRLCGHCIVFEKGIRGILTLLINHVTHSGCPPVIILLKFKSSTLRDRRICVLILLSLKALDWVWRWFDNKTFLNGCWRLQQWI